MKTKDELITKQQLEIENFKKLTEENESILKDLHNRFYSIGAPLNDNILKFDKKQMLWALKTYELIVQIN